MEEVATSISTPLMEGPRWAASFPDLLLYTIVIVAKDSLVKTAKRMHADFATLTLCANMGIVYARKDTLVVDKSVPKRACVNQTILV